VYPSRRKTKTAKGNAKGRAREIMTEQQHAARITDLERAIQTVIHDLRVPKKLRTALAVYQKQRDDQDNRKIETRGPERTEPTCLPKKTQSSLTIVSERCNPRNAAHEDSYFLDWPIPIEREIRILLWPNDESRDWSIEINGQRHEHVTGEIMEALVECALIVAQMSFNKSVQRLQ
jgi:hypothetical protein